MNIVLIGYRGSGKSAVGKRLATKLWREFVDTDVLVVQRAGKTIREIFESQGEAAFREMEAAVIAEVAARDNIVIAAGGGAVLRAENVAALKNNAKVIWLKASPEILLARITADTATAATRPNLTAIGGGGGLEEIKALLEERSPLYKAAADSSLDVGYLTVDAAIGYLVRMV